MPDELSNKAPSQSNQGDEGVNTQDPSDKLTPDHPRFKEVLDRAKRAEEQNQELSQRMADLEQQINARQTATGDDELTETEQRDLDRIDKALRARKGYVTKEDLEQLTSVERRAGTHDKLGSKYDGNNGLPKYDSLEVTEFAKRNGYGDNYEAAYKELHHQAIVQVEAKRLGSRNEPPTSERAGGGDKQIPGTEITRASIAAMSPAEYEANRDKILTAMKELAKRANTEY